MRALLGLALAAAALGGFPAEAEPAEWRIFANQYLVDGTTSTGYLATPVGPIPMGEPVVFDGIASIANDDVSYHTFTECRAGCDTADGDYGGARFDVRVEGGETATEAKLVSLNATLASAAGETIHVMCRVHNWMRAAIMVPNG